MLKLMDKIIIIFLPIEILFILAYGHDGALVIIQWPYMY